MKLLIVVYDQGIDETLMEHLETLDLPGWTKGYDLHGLGGQGLKLGDAVWPGQNNILYIELPDERVEGVVADFRRLQAGYRLKPGITLWSLPVEVL